MTSYLAYADLMPSAGICLVAPLQRHVRCAVARRVRPGVCRHGLEDAGGSQQEARGGREAPAWGPVPLPRGSPPGHDQVAPGVRRRRGWVGLRQAVRLVGVARLLPLSSYAPALRPCCAQHRGGEAQLRPQAADFWLPTGTDASAVTVGNGRPCGHTALSSSPGHAPYSS